MEDRALKTPLDIFCSNFLTRFCPRYKDPLLEAKLGCHDAGAYESTTSKISTSREWWGNIQARSKGSIYIHRVAPYNLAATCQNYPNTSSRHSIIFEIKLFIKRKISVINIVFIIIIIIIVVIIIIIYFYRLTSLEYMTSSEIFCFERRTCITKS